MRADVAGDYGQEAARKDVAEVRDEKEAVAGVDRSRRQADRLPGPFRPDESLGEIAHRLARGRGRASLFAVALSHIAPEVRRLGDLQQEGRLSLHAVEDCEQALALRRAEPAKRRTPSHRDEEEDLPEDDAESAHEV